mmetsp:Transcript_28155/g.32377  ORF Transcript_28155/g.32377 Transcript_28155/m.32377 type:complete len:112 (+) Transcript_28155:24-359(+)
MGKLLSRRARKLQEKSNENQPTIRSWTITPSTSMTLIFGCILFLSASTSMWEMKAYNTLFGMGSIDDDNSPVLVASTKSTAPPSITVEENRMVPGVSSNNNNNNTNSDSND